MRELTFTNGRVRDAPRIRLQCTACGELTRFTKEGETTVKCRECGKRHSTDSLVDTNTPGALDGV
jgi:uncharacterized Zn finger protein